MIRVLSFLIIILTFSIALVAFTSPNGAEVFSKQDTIPASRKRITDNLSALLGDRKKMPADSVYTNIQLFKGKDRISAQQLLDTMQYWSRSLDINCDYCHKENDWANEKPEAKHIARDMYRMQRNINDSLLTKIKHLASDPAVINCNTCHHGSVLPLD